MEMPSVGVAIGAGVEEEEVAVGDAELAPVSTTDRIGHLPFGGRRGADA